MASIATNRATYTSALIAFTRSYRFDGVDIDSEYPAVADRGGGPEDSANFVLLMREFKAAFGGKYGLSVTYPPAFGTYNTAMSRP